MWFLKSLKGERIYLKPNKETTIGRKRSNVVLVNDESISKAHASIIIEAKDVVQVNETTSTCRLKDSGSKYGTFVLLGSKLIQVTIEGCDLKHGDKIRFGLQHHIFTVIYFPIVTLMSNLNDGEKHTLQDLMNEIDGIVSDSWIPSITHLTVSTATLTRKVVWALAAAIPIVSLSYWGKVKTAFENSTEAPALVDSVPLLSEGFLDKDKVSLYPNEKRKTLFKDLIFVHFSKHQYKAYGRMIHLAGGESAVYHAKEFLTNDLCLKNFIVIQTPGNDATQSTQCIVPQYDAICNALQAKKLRMIPESEIALAILYCSLDKYCNPKFNFEKILKRSSVKYESASSLLAIDTQDASPDVRILPKVVSNVKLNSSVQLKRSIVIPESASMTSSYSDSPGTQQSQKSSTSSKERKQKKESHEEPDVAKDWISETPDSCQSTDSFIRSSKQIIEKMRSSKKNIKCIPETIESQNESSGVAETDVQHSLSKIQNFDSISIEAVKRTAKNIKYIPETNVSSSVLSAVAENEKESQRLTDRVINLEAISIEPVTRPKKNVKYIPETNDSSYVSDRTAEDETKNYISKIQNMDAISVENIRPKKNIHYIPETNESSYTSGRIAEKEIEQPTASKTTAHANTIDTKKENHLKLQKENSNILTINEKSNRISSDKESDDMFEISSSASDSDLPDCRNVTKPSGGPKKPLQAISKPKTKDNKRLRETDDESDKSESDMHNIVARNKRVCLKNSAQQKRSKEIPRPISSKRIDVPEPCEKLRRSANSLLRVGTGYKTFQKVHVAMPIRRIREMYV